MPQALTACSKPRRPNLHGLTPAQQAVLNRPSRPLVALSQQHRTDLNRVRAQTPNAPACDTNVLKFGNKWVWPFLDNMTARQLAITPKSLREVLKRARNEGVLLPIHYRLAKEYAAAFCAEYRRTHPAPPVSSSVTAAS